MQALSRSPRRLFDGAAARALLVLAAALAIAPARPAPAAEEAAKVSITESPDAYTLDNGIVTAMVGKRSGGLMSLRYKGLETLNGDPRHASGYWSHAPTSRDMTQSITIDPKSNDGARGEVAMKGISGGSPMGSGPGGSFIADIEVRYSLGRGESGVYTYSILDHKPAYPATSLGEARFCVKLSDALFDWMTVDAARNQPAITAYDWNHGTVVGPKETRLMTTGLYKGHVEHKYDYTAVQFETPAYGWSSTKSHVGVWIVNPTIEYLSGGPTKVEFCDHRDATFGTNTDAPAPPCLLNYWRSSHYGGSSCVVAAGEQWGKVVGPFMLYCNAGPSPDAMWKDALAVADREARAWPYDWVRGVDYPHRDARTTVSGRVELNDPQMKIAILERPLIGLTAPDFTLPAGRSGGGRRGPSVINWQLDAKHYQFWARGDEKGAFTIGNVRPGTYTLHAFARNVLGEFAKTNITVGSGGVLDLGRLEWVPVRYGEQVWEIGRPDRTAAEFRHGDHYWQWGLFDQYPKDFPDDVNFVIGKSDPRKDWNYCQCPRADRPNGTTWKVTFEMPEAPTGVATLRLAFAATSARSVDVAVNDKPAGNSGPLQDTATIRRDGISGYWYERPVRFDAALMKAGTNVLALTIPPAGATNGIEYDYLRLELDRTAAP